MGIYFLFEVTFQYHSGLCLVYENFLAKFNPLLVLLPRFYYPLATIPQRGLEGMKLSESTIAASIFPLPLFEAGGRDEHEGFAVAPIVTY